MVEAEYKMPHMTDEELKRLLESTAAANRQFFETVAEGLRHEMQVIAEGVTGARESLAVEGTVIREEVRRTASETQAMIKFSHAELDRRVRALEESQRAVEQSLADVQMRLIRLESSPH